MRRQDHPGRSGPNIPRDIQAGIDRYQGIPDPQGAGIIGQFQGGGMMPDATDRRIIEAT
jgi:hypothetical protein